MVLHRLLQVIAMAMLPLLLPVQAAVTGDHDHSRMTRHQTVTADLKVGPQTNPSESTVSYWRAMAKTRLLEKAEETLVKGFAKNVILFLGDGMSVPTLTAARIYMGQLNNESGESGQLSFEKFPYSGFSKTYCVDAQVGESACTSVAYTGGVKANSGTLGVTAAVARDDCEASLNTSNHVDTILAWAQEAGKATGLVTTTSITDASPAGHYAHSADRNWESDGDVPADSGCVDIAKQLVTSAPGKNCKVILAGGRRNFLPTNSSGIRLDNTDLTSYWLEAKKSDGSNATYITSKEEFMAIDVSKTDYLMGLFQDNHLLYHLEEGSDKQPTLAELTETAINILSKESKGFYLFVEGGKIDKAHHSNWARRSLDEANEFQKAIQVAVDMLDEKDTLIVVTADHAHTMSMAGYPDRGNDILGFADTGSDGLEYTTLSYANGPSAEVNRTGLRHNVGTDDLTNSTYQYPSLVPLDSETHGGDDVAVYARGPWAHLLSGNFEQTHIPLVMAYAANMGPMAVRDESTTTTSSPVKMTTTVNPTATTESSAASNLLNGSACSFLISLISFLYVFQ